MGAGTVDGPRALVCPGHRRMTGGGGRRRPAGGRWTAHRRRAGRPIPSSVSIAHILGSARRPEPDGGGFANRPGWSMWFSPNSIAGRRQLTVGRPPAD